MKGYIKLRVKNHIIVHGFDDTNKEITETVEPQEWTIKLVAIDRILSISEKFVLTHYSHGRIIYWEYQDGMSAIEEQLRKNELLIE